MAPKHKSSGAGNAGVPEGGWEVLLLAEKVSTGQEDALGGTTLTSLLLQRTVTIVLFYYQLLLFISYCAEFMNYTLHRYASVE